MTCLGIDIGGSSVKLAMLEDGRMLWTAQSRPYARPGTDQLVEAIAAAAQGRDAQADAVGLCVPGLLDKPRRIITLAVNVPGLMNIPLDELVAQALGRGLPPVRILNDAVASGHDIAAARGLRGRLLCLSLGTGIGAAVLDDGVPLIVEGESPGHVGQFDVSLEGEPVIGPDGGAGSLEGYLGSAALAARWGDVPSALKNMTIEDPPMRALARAIRICHAIYRPHHVCLAGGIGIRMKRLLDGLQSRINDRLTSVARPEWTLSCGDSDFHAALGAARLAARGEVPVSSCQLPGDCGPPVATGN